MNLLQLSIDNRDLPYTIDTYGMYTGDGADESEVEFYRDGYNLSDDETQLIDFDYDHAGVVKALAEASVQLLHENFVQHGDGTITGIELEKTRSPQYYNYTSDSYTAIWGIDETKLEAYIEDHRTEFNTFAQNSAWGDRIQRAYWNGGANGEFDEDDYRVASVDFYTRNEYNPEDYESTMFEFENEAWTENMTLVPEAQVMIDHKRDEIEAEEARIKNQTKLNLEG